MSKPRTRYRISTPEPANHLVHVEMEIDDAPEDGVRLVMPVWTPGSYLVREFSRHVARVTASRAGGDQVPVTKIAKNVWRVEAKPGKRVDVSYEVYANELTVRTSHVDADHAFLHPAATFLYVEGREAEPCLVSVEPPPEWTVCTALPLAGDDSYGAESLDHLLDSPFEIGTHQTLRFDVEGVPHRIALFGGGNFDLERLVEDTHEICRTAAGILGGGHPCKSYDFIFHVVEGAGGGLEHLDSSVCGFSPTGFRPERGYTRQLSLISHEYFHLWNVKRIRPRELGPFDYTTENYSRLLWVSEGFTSYYQDVILRRAGLVTVPIFLDDLAALVRVLMETPGREQEPVAEASFDAWIKLYRPHENIRNVTVSYYLKGAMVALLLDLTIRDATEGERSLDDVMRSLWAQWRARPEEGFTEEELNEALAEAAGRSLGSEIAEWVHGTSALPFEELFGKVGLALVPRGDGDGEQKAYLGVTTKENGGKILVREVLAGSPAASGGLDANDELVALDGWRVSDLKKRLEDVRPGDEVVLTVARRGRLRRVKVVAGEAPVTDRVLRPLEDAGERESRLFESWLGEPLGSAAEKPPAAPPDRRPRPV
jgi:predicted metalloprotease with PDZ domain